MASRLRIFVKKRGTRRTGARWQGMLLEGLLAVTLILIGLYGLYWLLDRIFWVEGPGFAWWRWIVMIIPASLVAYGTTNLVQLLWRSTISSERRAAVVQKATDWELPGGQANAGRPALPTVPPIDAVIDSPGIHLAYRLPIDTASGWLSFTMAAVCLGWITLVAMLFVFNVVGQGSQWNLTNALLAVGDDGTAALNITDGGKVFGLDVLVGADPTSTGMVVVSGAGQNGTTSARSPSATKARARYPSIRAAWLSRARPLHPS